MRGLSGTAGSAARMQELLSAVQPSNLAAVELPGDLKVLVLAPHPDDFDAIAITMRRFRDNGNPISLAVVTSGASGVEDSFCSLPTRKRKSALREAEQRESCRFFGLPEARLSFLRLAEDEKGHPRADPANEARIRDALVNAVPDVVFLPHPNDTNAGHRRTYAMLCSVAGQEALTFIAFLNRDPKTIAMRIDVFLPFGESDARWKAEMLRFHESQQQRNLSTRARGLDDRILDVNQRCAAACPGKIRYAETFELEFWENGAKAAC